MDHFLYFYISDVHIKNFKEQVVPFNNQKMPPRHATRLAYIPSESKIIEYTQSCGVNLMESERSDGIKEVGHYSGYIPLRYNSGYTQPREWQERIDPDDKNFDQALAKIGLTRDTLADKWWIEKHRNISSLKKVGSPAREAYAIT